jgi:SAM-dependent methyltransferase
MDTFLQQMLADEERQAGAHDYLAYHHKRFEYVIALCQQLKPRPDTRVLDIGRSYLSLLLAEHYESVTTLGLPLGLPLDAHGFGGSSRPEYEGKGPAGHIVFNLNDCGNAVPPTDTKFDLIVFGETIEHLVTPPELVLHTLAGMLDKNGVLLVQTPNAASLRNRLMLLAGRNPFLRLRFNQNNPGHIREYTKTELKEIGEVAGLHTVQHEYKDYFTDKRPGWKGLVEAAIGIIAAMVQSFRMGQTIVYSHASILYPSAITQIRPRVIT